MSLMTRAFAALTRMPLARTHRIRVDRGLSIPVGDGISLVADRYYPEAGGNRLPILLNRTPYGRQAEGGLGRLFAERGYQVLVVSCRGTFGSGGEWDPFWNEQRDGHAVLEWMAQQPWFTGKVGLFGGSYHGLTQWAVASDPPPYVKAMAPLVTSTFFGDLFYPGGAFALESALTWTMGLKHQELPRAQVILVLLTGSRRVAKASVSLPLADAERVLGRDAAPYYREWLEHPDIDDSFWNRIDFGKDLSAVPPAMLVAGWYDVFGASQIEDFARLRASGREATLRVGPWTHASLGTHRFAIRETLAWMDRHLRDGHHVQPGKRVKLFVMGAKRWAPFDEWPPPATATRWYLHPGGRLSNQPPAQSPPDSYRYDPTNPTPGIGGASLSMRNSGPKDNRKLEARADVLVYSSEMLTEPVTVIGPLTAELRVRSNREHTDFFARLCDVFPDGKSINLSDGILRLKPGDVERLADGSYRIALQMFPTANTFLPGHRIRLQVSSGAHPIYAHNPGTGESLATATHLVAADQEVFHDPERSSAIVLPIVSESVLEAGWSPPG